MFVHTPLENAETQIRLVQILSGEDDQSIALLLSVHTLDVQEDTFYIEGEHVELLDHLSEMQEEKTSSEHDSDEVVTPSNERGVDYIALSYMWGPPQPSRAILVNGKEFVVRMNLWDALHTIRRRGVTERFYWIDQLCIDQANLLERGQQVQRMDTIYSCASIVMIWLGSRPYIDTLLRLAGRCISRIFAESLDSINDAHKVKQARLPDEALLSPALQDSSRPLEAVLDIERLEPEEVPLFKNAFELAFAEELCDLGITETEFLAEFQNLRSNPYWRRAWIIQETLLANDLQILGHKWELPWPIFALFHEALRGLEGTTVNHRDEWRTALFDGVFRILDMRSLMEGATGRFGIPFAALMTNMPSVECSDQRDRFYSILGIIPQEEVFEVDYSISTRTLYFRILAWLDPSDNVLYVYSVAILLGLNLEEIIEGVTRDEQRIFAIHKPPVGHWALQ